MSQYTDKQKISLNSAYNAINNQYFRYFDVKQQNNHTS